MKVLIAPGAFPALPFSELGLNDDEYNESARGSEFALLGMRW